MLSAMDDSDVSYRGKNRQELDAVLRELEAPSKFERPEVVGENRVWMGAFTRLVLLGLALWLGGAVLLSFYLTSDLEPGECRDVMGAPFCRR